MFMAFRVEQFRFYDPTSTKATHVKKENLSLFTDGLYPEGHLADKYNHNQNNNNNNNNKKKNNNNNKKKTKKQKNKRGYFASSR